MKAMKVIFLSLVLSVTVGSNIHTKPPPDVFAQSNPQSPMIEYGEATWHTEVVDNDDVKGWTSIDLDSNNRPHISYCEDTTDLVRYAYYDGSIWNKETVNLGYSHNTGHTSIALDSNDHPHISFFETNDDDLWYANKTSGSWSLVQVDYGGNVGLYTSIAIDANDYSHISYYDAPNDEDLKHAYYDGSDWNREKPYTSGVVGLFTSIALDVNDYPHISHYDDRGTYNSSKILYTYQDASGWHTLTVDDCGFGDSWSSIDVDDDGRAYISYRFRAIPPGSERQMFAIHYGSGSWSRLTVESDNVIGIGTASAIAVDDSKAQIAVHLAYRGVESGSTFGSEALKYAYHYYDLYEEVVDSSDDLGGNNVAIAINDCDWDKWPHVHLSYWDEVTRDLKYAFRNNIPWATISISPTFPRDGDDLIVNYTYNDGNGDPDYSEIKWHIDGNYNSNYDGVLIIPDEETSIGQIWEVSVTPDDGYDVGTAVSSEVRINALPVASDVQLSPVIAYSNNDLNGIYVYSDANNDLESSLTEIRWYKDDAPAGNDDIITLPYSETRKHQTWYFTVRPHDGYEYGDAVGSNSVTILNSVPAIVDPHITPVRPVSSNDLDANYVFSDVDYPEVDPDLSEIYWFKNSTQEPLYNNWKRIPASETAKRQTWRFIVEAYDGEEYGNTGYSEMVIINSPPKAHSCTITPGQPRASDDLSANYSYYDFDGDTECSTPPLGTQIRWFTVLGGLQPFDNELQIPNSATTPGENWYFTVRPHDCLEYGQLAISDTVRINIAPSVSNLSLTPTIPYTTDDLVADYDFTDADGDNDHSEIKWYIVDGGLQPGYGDSILPADATAKGQQWYVTVKAHDGIEYGNVLTSPVVTVINSPPLICAAWITPYPWTENDLYARYQCSDADDDPVGERQIRWFKDELLQTGYNDKLRVPSSVTSVGEKWYFNVRASDGTDFCSFVKSEELVIKADPNEPPGCFLSGTSILLADGSEKPIEDMEVGDEVLSYDERSGKMRPERVNEIFRHPKEDTYLIVNGHLRVTPVHPVLSKGKWTSIGDLRVGDKLTNLNGNDVRIESVITVKDSVDVYNFEVNLCHTYVAEGYVVHNRKVDKNQPEIVVPDAADVETMADVTTAQSDFVGVDNRLQDSVFDLNPSVPETHALHQNVPNPFNPETSIKYDVSDAGGTVTLRIYDTRGRLIRTLVNSLLPPGEHTATWNARDDNGNEVATGVYFYRLSAAGFVETRKMLLLR